MTLLEYQPKLCHRIRIAIAESGLRQRDVADYLGVTQAAVSSWITGKNSPRVSHLIELSILTDCPWLLDLRGLGSGCNELLAMGKGFRAPNTTETRDFRDAA